MPTPDPYQAGGDLPLTISPGDAPASERSVDALCAWIERNLTWVRDRQREHGALRFRGFQVEKAQDFERVARAIDSELQNEYLGTSPRDGVTDYVFNASELPEFYPIPQHCEMSFCAHPPRRVFFCCLVEPAAGGGETPLCDFRAVWRDLDPAVRDRFVERGLRIVRNYSGPGQTDDGDPMRLKRWDEMFLTTDKSVVEAMCRAEGFEPIWLGAPDGSDAAAGESLRLISTQPVYRDHPESGERVWHNHLTTFHVGMPVAEYRRIAALRPSDRHRGLLQMAERLEEGARSKPSDEQSMHCTYLDGSEVESADLEHVRDVVWRHMKIDPWKRGDVVAIDNHSVSHGRLPYEGDRHVVVCWA